MSDSLFVTTTILESLSYKRRNKSTEFPESGYCPAISTSLSVNVYKTNRSGENLNIHVGVIDILCAFYMTCIFHVNLFTFHCN